MKLDDVISLAEAGEDLGIDPSGLRAQAAAGRFEAKLVGKTWVTTKQAVEAYRRDRLGQVGRPPSILKPQRPPFADVLGDPDEPNILGDRPRR